MENQLEVMRQFYLARKTIFLPDIDDTVATQVITDLAMLAEDAPDHIRMTICSNGGITEAGFAIAQFIEFELGIPVHARVFGACCSAATYALLTCQERVGNELTSFVIHRQTSSIELEYVRDFDADVAGWQAENEQLHERQVRFYSCKLGITRNEAEALLDRGSARTNNRIDAVAAKKLGLLTKIEKLSPAMIKKK